MKISIWNLAHVITSWTSPTMQRLGQIGPAGASPYRGNIRLWLFCYPVLFFSVLCPGWTVALLLTVNGLNDVFPPKDGPFGGRDNGRRHMGKICPKNSPKRGVNRQFQAKTPKSIHRNISGTINPTNLRFEDRVQITKCTSWLVRHYNKANTTWLTAAIFKIDMTSYFRSRCSDLDEIRQPDAQWHADYGEMVGIETGNRIPTWQTFVFPNRK